ncbi:MAG: hypothetical protein PHE52_01400 [Candidatus Pacebacteria bacterium]|nr:hypothetical protein [Candidatus Paceibacterota bacterium]
MPKNQTIILVVVILIILGGLISWEIFQKSKLSGGEQTGGEQEVQEVLSLSGIVQSVDEENNALMVKPANQENEVKVILSETTKLIKLEFPFDPKNPPAEGTFTPTQTEIEISDFKQGDNVFIKVKEDIAGKTEFDSVDFIQILP